MLHESSGRLRVSALRSKRRLNHRPSVEECLGAVRSAPLDGRGHYLLGCALHENQEREAAVQAYRRAIELNPADVDAMNNLGIAYQELGRLESAIDAYRKTLELNPQVIAARTNLGIALQTVGKLDEALESLKTAYQLFPHHVPTILALGQCCLAKGLVNDAGECFGAAAQIDPQNADVFYNLGLAHQSLGHHAFTAQAYRAAADLSPKYSRLLELSYLQQLNNQDDLESRFVAAIEALIVSQRSSSIVPVPPFVVMTSPVEATSQTQWECARYWSRHTYGHIPRLNLPPRPRKNRIRLGYLSPDFRGHPGSVLIAELLEKHARDQFEVFAYSLAPPDDTVFRRRIVEGCDQFVELRGCSVTEAAYRIATDEVDILIDISGYTLHSRTEIAAMRPAPIQVAYLGFPGTMGADFIDYILVDEYVVPFDRQAFFTEKLVHLPGCYQVNSRQWPEAATPTRADVGLPDEAFVFCAFNANYKITTTMFRVWLRLLTAVPGSVLWLLEGPPQSVSNLRHEAARHGVEPSRLVFAPKLPLSQHLARHRLADLFLDCYPVNAHTTAGDALRTGLPVLTISGQTFISRVAGSLLRTVGLSELIMQDFQSYEQAALQLATDRPLLENIRRKLLANISESTLFDIYSATNKIEKAYHMMYQRLHDGLPPESFRVQV